jgi:RND superfamily putative drug exporter
MVVIFASFIVTRVTDIKQLGCMLAVAVLLDATLVRLLLGPAVMRLVGPRIWWLPRRLDRVLPRTLGREN